MFIEAGNMEKFTRNFEEVEEIVIPEVHWEYTARSVLVMGYVEGLKMDAVEAIRERGIDPGEIAMIGLRSFSRQLFDFGFFHADPHPANTIVLYDGRVALVDFGITGYLDEEVMRQIANLFLGYAEHDYDLVMEALWDAGLIDENRMDLDSFRTDLKDVSEPFYGRNLKTISVRDVYDQVMQLVIKYQIRLPRNLLLLLKTFIQTEALGKILDSDANLLEVTRPYAKRLLQRGYEAHRLFRGLTSELHSARGMFKSVPRLIHRILRQTAGGSQRIELLHTGFDRIDNKMEKWVNRLTVGIIISASTIAGALVLTSPRKVYEFSLAFLNGQSLSLTGVLGITGYTIATVLGVWLILSIFRSGRL
jgi:ubiquinone biosynthesis protein